MNITRTPVKSSALAEMGYDQASETLEVQFHGKGDEPGAEWLFAPVTPAVYASLLLPGASIGSIFAREVKANPLVIGTRVKKCNCCSKMRPYDCGSFTTAGTWICYPCDDLAYEARVDADKAVAS